MAPGDWSTFARALRAQKRNLEKQIEDAPNEQAVTAATAAMLVLGSLENAAMHMAGGYVYD